MERIMKNKNESSRGDAVQDLGQVQSERAYVAPGMQFSQGLRRNGWQMAASVAVMMAVAACSSPGGSKRLAAKPEIDKKYGVVASPRLVDGGKKVPRGGGRYVVGKPYKIAGKTYRPRVDPRYKKVGLASWYGKAFHGRQTANGEIFDMNRLTAAHTTMPLPSYARVTNVENGRSVIVRVNDRGPFHGNRVIDLSKRTSDVLDFQGAGIAKVKVEYVGRARLDGRDDEYLSASYRGPGKVAPGGSYPGTQLAQLDRLPPGAVVGEAPKPRASSRPTPVLAAFDPARAPTAGAGQRNPVARQERAVANPSVFKVAKSRGGSLDDDVLGYGGYGQYARGNKYSLQRVYSRSGKSYVTGSDKVSSAVGTHGSTSSDGVRPLNLPGTGQAYVPSYAPESRIDKAFVAISYIFQ